jgi:hypothetical protein
VGAENVLGIAEGDRLAISPPPGRIDNARGDLEFTDGRLAVLARPNAVPLEKPAFVGHSEFVRGLANSDGELALVNPQPVPDADQIAAEIVGFLDKIDGCAELLGKLAE